MLDDKTISGLGRQELIDQIKLLLDDVESRAATLANRSLRFRRLLERAEHGLSEAERLGMRLPDPDGASRLMDDIRAALREER